MANDDFKIEAAQFLGLISLLSNSALQQLGKVISPVTGKVEKNLEGARLTVDWLIMLENKTKNNLTNEEQSVLQSYISNLQLNYMDELKKSEENPHQPEEKSNLAKEK